MNVKDDIFFSVFATTNISDFKVRFLAHKSNVLTFDAFQKLARWVNSNFRTISRWNYYEMTVMMPS